MINVSKTASYELLNVQISYEGESTYYSHETGEFLP